MTASKLLNGLNDALAWTKATRGGRELPNEADRAFLSCLSITELRVPSKAHSQDARQHCYMRDWAMPGWSSDGRIEGWFLLPAGHVVLETRVHASKVYKP